jgi:hypothetical protein
MSDTLDICRKCGNTFDICMQGVHISTHLKLGHKHESKDAKRYTYQTQTVKPVIMSDSTASVTELITAGHCVVGPHDVLDLSSQALCGIQYDKILMGH